MSIRQCATALLLVFYPFCTNAGELEFGLGLGDLRQGGSYPLVLEIRDQPLFNFWGIKLGVGASIEKDNFDAIWLGLGPYIHKELPDKNIRLSFSVYPGVYKRNHGLNLGHNFLFRLQVGVSYLTESGWRWGGALEHKSHGYIKNDNPGTEALVFTISRETD